MDEIMLDEVEKYLLEGNRKFRWKVMQEEESIEIEKFPKFPVLILTCMDPRIDVYKIFHLELSNVFILRNAGNTYTEDVLRSILVAIYEYKVKHLFVLGHLDCGMKKIQLHKLKDKLDVPTLKMIGRKGTNFNFELQKFFALFKDEIINIKNQVQKLQESKEIPSYVKIKGMLYDPNTGWVIEEEKFSKYSFYESFAKDYRTILQNKQLELVDYIETIEDKIIGEVDIQKIDEKDLKRDLLKEKETFDTKVKDTIEHNIAKELTVSSNIIEETEPYIENLQIKLIKVPKIQIPKFYIPKVKVHLPVIYKKKERK